MPPGLPPVIAVPGGQRPDLDDQVLLPGGEPPGAVPAGRAGLIGASKGEPGLPGGSWPSGFRRLAGRAQPCPTACPSLSVTVTHQVDRGLRAAAAARSRARSGSTGPIPPISPGWRRDARHGGSRRLAAIPARVTEGSGRLEIWCSISAQIVGNLAAKVATRCRAEPGDLCAGTRMAWSDGRPTTSGCAMCEHLLARMFMHLSACPRCRRQSSIQPS